MNILRVVVLIGISAFAEKKIETAESLTVKSAKLPKRFKCNRIYDLTVLSAAVDSELKQLLSANEDYCTETDR